MVYKFISYLIILQMLLPWAAYAKNKTDYSSKKCGEFIIISDVEAIDGVYVCREDSGVMDEGVKTPEAKTLVHTTPAIAEAARNSSKIIDQILLAEIKERAEKRLERLEPIEDLPQNEDTEKLKAHVKDFKRKIMDSSRGAIHQIRTILTVFPEIEEELIKENPEYKALICKYQIWKHKREVLSKIAVTTSKIMSYMLLLSAPIGGLAFVGYFSIQTFASILIGLGIAQSTVGSFELVTTIRNWDDVRAGSLAKMALKIDKSLQQYVKELQKNPKENEAKILEMQGLLLSTQDAKDLKNVKKLKGKRIKQVIGSTLKIISGAAAIQGGMALKNHFKDFTTTEPAQNVNEPPTPGSGGTPPIPGSGGNDTGGGFLGDDGG